jgi:parallel beta-helix repeat protein
MAFYVDLDAVFVSGRDGSDTTTNVATGLGGLMQVLNGWGPLFPLTSGGNIINVRGKADTRTVVKCNVTVDKSATWIHGDTVMNNAEGGHSVGDTWIGSILAITGTTVRISLTSGFNADVDSAVGIFNSVRVDNITAAQFTSKENLGVELSPTSGTAVTGANSLIGVDNNWNEVLGKMAIFDGNDASPCITHIAAMGRWRFVNLRATQSSGDGFNHNNQSNSILRYLQCKADNCTGAGFDFEEVGNLICWRCIARDNTSHGFVRPEPRSRYFGCVAANNGGHGINVYTQGSVLYSLAYGNTSSGILVDGVSSTNVTIYGNDVEDNADGIKLTNDPASFVVLGNRISNNSLYGLNVPATYFKTLDDWNVYYNNTSGHRTSTIIKGDNTVDATGSADYIDKTNDNYNVRPDGDIFLEEILLDWDL